MIRPSASGMSARRLLTAPHQYLAPDLLFPEVGNVIWKKVQRGELTAREGGMLAADLASVAVEAVASRVLVSDAVALATALGLAVCDATYLALAVRLDTVLVTADERLGRAVAPHPVAAAHVRMVQTSAS